MVNDTVKSFRLFSGLFIVLAFFVQSVIPVGYMPKFDAGHFFEITICHGADITKIVVDENMQPVTDVQKKSAGDTSTENHKPCLYSAVSFKSLGLPFFVYHHVEQLIYEQYVDRGSSPTISILTHPPYEGRAPPISFV